MPENEQNPPRDVPLVEAEDPNMPQVEVPVEPLASSDLDTFLDALEDHADTAQCEAYRAPYIFKANAKYIQERPRGLSECYARRSTSPR